MLSRLHRFAKDHEPTAIERIMSFCLWRLNLKYHSEYVIDPYIVDFYIKRYHLIVECDGAFHKNQKEYDRKREQFLRSKGFHVVHFWGWEFKDEYRIYDKMVDVLSSRGLRNPLYWKQEMRKAPPNFGSDVRAIDWYDRKHVSIKPEKVKSPLPRRIFHDPRFGEPTKMSCMKMYKLRQEYKRQSMPQEKTEDRAISLKV